VTSPFPSRGKGRGWGGGTASPASPEDSEAVLIDRFARTPKIKTGGIDRARRLRAETTRTESKLWQHLRQLDIRFRRQAPIGPYVVDFACHSARLVIEVDGGVHDRTDVALRDLERDKWFATQGYRVIRIPTKRIETEVDSVVAAIAKAAGVFVPPGSARASTPSQPFPLEGKGSSEI